MSGEGKPMRGDVIGLERTFGVFLYPELGYLAAYGA